MSEKEATNGNPAILVLNKNQRYGCELVVFHTKTNYKNKDCVCKCEWVCVYVCVCHHLEKWLTPQMEQGKHETTLEHLLVGNKALKE